MTPRAESREYSAPALDKGLDILELLANEASGLTQTEIADAVGRTVSQIFRVLATLEKRGYIYRDRQSGIYGLSMRLFDLAHQHPPLRGLIAVAIGPMRELSERVAQSCNLSVLDEDRVRIIAQVESPADFGYRVRIGATFPIETTASGAVLTSGLGSPIARDGYLSRADALQAGITDVVAGISDVAGTTVAALTVPYVATSFSATSVEDVIAATTQTARAIAGRLLGVSG
ncbi:MAG TPA: helix-turn-helix domain-containing protein [Galbitalea sp.]|nr:helix-turn-helix domain-containing protein [Galbitalea sp.]